MALCEVDPLFPRLLQRVAGLGVDRALLRAEPGTTSTQGSPLDWSAPRPLALTSGDFDPQRGKRPRLRSKSPRALPAKTLPTLATKFVKVPG